MTIHPKAEIFSQGEEVINGQIADTNAAWLSQQLVEMGFVISRHSAVGDKLDDLSELLKEISLRADFCVCSGGLGPTIDDLTAQAVAQAFDRPLQLDPVALSQIEHCFSIRNRKMADANRKQAYFPEGAIRLENSCGTAPGFALLQNRCWFVFVPGVPSEMREMFNLQIKQGLNNRFTLQPDKLVTIKTIGIGESDLQQKLNDCSFPQQMQLGFRATSEEVQTKLLFPADMDDLIINHQVEQVVALLGHHVFSVAMPNQPGSDLLSVISQSMEEKQLTLTVIETMTQGMIAAKCISQDWLLGSRYIQVIEDLMTQLDIPQQEELSNNALAIGQKLQQTHSADLILVQLYSWNRESIQQQENSVIIYNTLITRDRSYQETITVSGSIKRKQNQAAIRALDFLRRVLQKKCH